MLLVVSSWYSEISPLLALQKKSFRCPWSTDTRVILMRKSNHVHQVAKLRTRLIVKTL